jgi:general secretion pathway protein H
VGYTLVELLVVAAIVGMLVVTAALAWRSDPARTLEAEARRLAAQLELAQARTRITGTRIAFSTSPDGYLFWLRDHAGIWREIDGDAGLSRRTLVPGISVRGMQLSGTKTLRLPSLWGDRSPPRPWPAAPMPDR